MELFYVRLKRLREARKLSQKEVAAAIEVPVTTYREWEQGRAIQGEPYDRIARVLRVGIQELITGRCPEKQGVLKRMDLAIQALQEAREELLSYF